MNRRGYLAVLRGDPSDGLPGVRGIGGKGAAKLLTDYGSLDGVLAAAPSLTPRLRDALEGARDYIAAMREVVPVRRDVDCRVSPAGSPDVERLRTLGERHAIDGPVTRMLAAIAAGPGVADPP